MKRKIIWYNPNLKKKARELRKHSTTSEIKLWMFLKNKQMLGYDFHRQKSLDQFFVDFFCNELMLAIEIDGLSHHNTLNNDMNRQKRLESFGIKFLRFEDDEVFYNIEVVLDKIEKWIIENK